MGKIALEGMRFYAYHGYYKSESKIGNYFIVDISFNYDTLKAGESDELSDTLNYEDIYRITEREMNIRSKLLEHVCHRIYNAITISFSDLLDLSIRVSKLNPPVGGETERVYVEYGG